MVCRLLVLLMLSCALPAAARDRRELVSEAQDRLRQAVDVNDESDSDCHQELEGQLVKALRLTRDASRGSERAIRKALEKAESARDTADDCPGRNTRETLVPLRQAVKMLHYALNPDEEQQGDGESPDQYGGPPPSAQPPMVSPPAMDVGTLSVTPNQDQGYRFAQINVFGLHLRGMGGRDVILSTAVKTFRGGWMEAVNLPSVRCDYDDCGWDQGVTFNYPEELLRGQNFDDGRFLARLSAVDARTRQTLAARETPFQYDFQPTGWGQPVEQPQPVISVELEPPVGQPEAIQVEWAPPPMLAEAPSPQPGPDYSWVGGYWSWQGEWVWAAGHWRRPPVYGYSWCQPYYENRDSWVVFVPGHWQRPGVTFMPPPRGAIIARVEARPGAVRGVRPMGPSGVFVPPPPGSRPGVIVSAPIGTSPAVVTSAPPVLRPGMRIEGVPPPAGSPGRGGVFTVVAPAGVTATGRPVQSNVPAAPHLAAALPPVVRVMAPPPSGNRPVPTFVPGRPPPELPRAQPTRVTPPASAVASRPGVGARPVPLAPPPPRPGQGPGINATLTSRPTPSNGLPPASHPGAGQPGPGGAHEPSNAPRGAHSVNEAAPKPAPRRDMDQ